MSMTGRDKLNKHWCFSAYAASNCLAVSGVCTGLFLFLMQYKRLLFYNDFKGLLDYDIAGVMAGVTIFPCMRNTYVLHTMKNCYSFRGS